MENIDNRIRVFYNSSLGLVFDIKSTTLANFWQKQFEKGNISISEYVNIPQNWEITDGENWGCKQSPKNCNPICELCDQCLIPGNTSQFMVCPNCGELYEKIRFYHFERFSKFGRTFSKCFEHKLWESVDYRNRIVENYANFYNVSFLFCSAIKDGIMINTNQIFQTQASLNRVFEDTKKTINNLKNFMEILK